MARRRTVVGPLNADLVNLLGGELRRPFEQNLYNRGELDSPVVFLIGGIESSTIWKMFEAELRARNVSFCVHQLSGCGSRPETLKHTSYQEMLSQAQSALCSLATLHRREAEGTIKLNLVGHSLGACVASELGCNDALLQRLGCELATTTFYAPAFALQSRLAKLLMKLPHSLRRRICRARRGEPLDWLINRMAGREFQPHNRVWNEVFLYRYYPAKFFPELCLGMHRLRELVSELPGELVVEWGKHDLLTEPPEEWLPATATLTQREQSGHFIPLDHDAAKALEALIKRLQS